MARRAEEIGVRNLAGTHHAGAGVFGASALRIAADTLGKLPGELLVRGSRVQFLPGAPPNQLLTPLVQGSVDLSDISGDSELPSLQHRLATFTLGIVHVEMTGQVVQALDIVSAASR
jgi:hypothetical protein